MLICYSAHLSIDVHCSTHLKKKKIFLFHSLIKIIQTYIILLFLLIQDLPSEASFFFFHHLIKLSHFSSSSSSLRSLSSALISHQAFISPQHQSQSRRHRCCQPQPQPSPSPSHAVAIASPSHNSITKINKNITYQDFYCIQTILIDD